MQTVGVDPQLRANYDTYYGDVSELAQWRELGAIDKAANVQALCSRYAPATVLEIGAGEGSLLARLALQGVGQRHSALEISASGVERIRARNIPSLAECRQFDGYTVPYPDASFDLVVLSHVLEHVEHPRLLLNEAARVGRWLFVEVPLEHTRRLPRDFVWDSVGHINFYTAQTIRLLVQSCGHEVLAQQQTHPGRRAYTYRLGGRGVAAHAIKELALRIVPSTAQRMWAYNSSLLIRPRHAQAPAAEECPATHV
jgi:SAM-dependent methyltransferase